jgi:uncharacterized repeat protein (TIGR01451 family)
VLRAGGKGAANGAPCTRSGGGDGGWGVYGGGGGGSGTTAYILTDPNDPNSYVGVESGGGGGGAGSSLAPAGGTVTTDSTGVPEIVISYSLADLSTSISGPATVSPGSNLTYVVTVANAGPAAAGSTVLSSSIPARAQFQSVSTSSGQCTAPAKGATSGQIVCSLGDLAAPGSATVRVVLKSGGPKGSVISFSASATSVIGDPNSANNAGTRNTTIVQRH